MILGEKNQNLVKLIINSTEIEETEKAVLLGITTDNLLTFNVVQQIINYMHYEE